MRFTRAWQLAKVRCRMSYHTGTARQTTDVARQCCTSGPTATADIWLREDLHASCCTSYVVSLHASCCTTPWCVHLIKMNEEHVSQYLQAEVKNKLLHLKHRLLDLCQHLLFLCAIACRALWGPGSDPYRSVPTQVGTNYMEWPGLRELDQDAAAARGGHASIASEQQYLFLTRKDKPLLVGQYVVVIQADMGQPLVDIQVGTCSGAGDRSKQKTTAWQKCINALFGSSTSVDGMHA